MFDREQADFVCDYLECLTCSSGVPLRLIDWQRDMVQAFYGEMTEDEDAPGEYLRKYQYLYLEIPKKNGKSEIAAGLGTYHLFADGETNGEIYLVAADRDNAGIVFAAAKFMVEEAWLSSSLKLKAASTLSMLAPRAKISEFELTMSVIIKTKSE